VYTPTENFSLLSPLFTLPAPSTYRMKVRNGEGTNHVMSIAVTGAPSDALALQLGRAVVNSPLLKVLSRWFEFYLLFNHFLFLKVNLKRRYYI